MDTITLLIIANKIETKIFKVNLIYNRIELVDLILNKKGRLKESELVSDAPGTSTRSSGGFRNVKNYSREKSASQNILNHYIHAVHHSLQQLMNDNPQRPFILAAEPGLQGKIMKVFKNKKLLPNRIISKELNHLTDREILKYSESDIQRIFPISKEEVIAVH